MKLKVYSKDGSRSTEKDFNLPVIEGDKGRQALKDTLVSYQANARQGSANTKDYGEVKSTGKKPFRQKGTGGARHGSLRSPLHRKGAVVFGPRPRDWSKKINDKVKSLAFARMLSDKATSGEISLIEAFELPAPKTKAFTAVLKHIYPEGKVLVVDGAFAEATSRAARNVARVKLGTASTVNALDLALFDRVLISEAGFETILSRVNV